LNKKKLRGSLTKWPGRRGTGGFQPLDRDLRVQEEGVRRSNLGRPSGIGRLGGFGRVGWRRCSPAGVLRGGGSPALSNPALWGLIRAGVWPWSTAVACVVHWRARTGSAGLGTGSSTARAARRPRSSPEHGAGAPRARQGLWDLAQGSRRSGRGSPGVETDGGATQMSRRRAREEAHRRSSRYGSLQGSRSATGARRCSWPPGGACAVDLGG